jgi:anaerobic selenocysteine-containing dehydrogenase
MGRLPVCDIYGFGGEMPACIMIWGCHISESGAADGMCGGMLNRAISKAKKVIVVDPRLIGPAEREGALWLQLRPGTDGALALAMINTVATENLIDHDFVANHTVGYDALKKHIRAFTPEWAAPITGLKAEDIAAAARIFTTTHPACIQWSNGMDMNICSFQTSRALLILISGVKIRNFFHSELRQVEELRRLNPDPLVEIHPDTAASLKISDGDWVWIESPYSRVKMKAKFFDGIAPQVVSAQHGWWFPEQDPPITGGRLPT